MRTCFRVLRISFTKLTMHCNNPELYPSATGQHAGQPRYGHLIGNRWIDGTGTPLPVIAPATGECFAWLSNGGSAEIDAAVAAARAALALEEVSTTKTVVNCYL